MVGTPIIQVQRPINQGLIKDLILPLLSVDLEMAKEQERKMELPGIKTQGLWLSVPVLCH